MRILLTANASYAPPRGGATRTNLAWLQQLARNRHECRVVAASLDREGEGTVTRDAVEIRSFHDPAHRGAALRNLIRDWNPDWVLVSSEDVGQVLLREALAHAPGKVVYLAHTPQFFGFGPQSWNPDSKGAQLLQSAAGVVAIGQHIAGYIERHAGVRPAVIHPPIYGSGPWRRLASFDRGMVTMINPCAIKGGPIFCELARRFPQVPFGALPGWATTAADLAALAALPNMSLLPPCADIEDFLGKTRILMMPSLWYEGFGLIVVEAMLRGIPVVASNSGGLEEATLGAGFLVPVRPIERYEPVFDEHAIPRAVIPEQNIEPWAAALERLLAHRAAYQQASDAARQAALRFVETVRPDGLERFLTRRRLLLAHNSTYFPAYGGGDKSNRLLMEALAARGHRCRVLARTAGYGPAEHQRHLGDLAARSVNVKSAESGVVVFDLNGVEVHTVTDHPNLRACFADAIAAFQPDVIVASADDPAQVLLEVALDSTAPVVYLARATLALPFGPDAAFRSEEKTAPLRRVSAVVGVSEYVARYIRDHSGIPAVHVPISPMEPGPWPVLGRFENEFVLMVNPCAVKGIEIFLALADCMPQVAFAAVTGWGTSPHDLARLRRRANIRLLEPADNIDDILRRARVLLVPSLWAEARSRIVVEAMLRGVPVVASDVGGIPEAKLGVDYLLPVRPIERYQPRLDEQMVPVAEVPEQDPGPWRAVLTRLLSDRPHFERLSRESREAALRYAEGLSTAPFEDLIHEVTRRPKAPPEPPPAPRPATMLETLSPEKRALLALRLRKRAAAEAAWFPTAEANPKAAWRLFCFPHAGGGVSAFAGWSDHLPACPARLPGRETRLHHPPIDRMDALVKQLADAIQPFARTPFAFFGHSMGAAIAFELARELRRRGQPGPFRLIVSAARAPQFRLGHVPGPEPDDEELVDQLRRLEGAPPEVLENRELMTLLLPALRADTALYRRYVYVPEAPLDCPISAFGGAGDANIRPEHLDGWREQTTSAFELRLLPGGHFYYRGNPAGFARMLLISLPERCNYE